MKINSIGIVGHGFVGEALAFAFSPSIKTKVYDIDTLKSTDSLKNVLDSEFVFVCLPTPMKSDGTQDISFISNFFRDNCKYDKPIFIIKSTVLPGTTKKLSNLYPNLKIIFSPEFLTERTAKLDVLTQTRIIIGSDNKKY